MWGLGSFTVEGSPNIRILLASRLVLHAAPIFYEFVFGKKTVHSHGPFPYAGLVLGTFGRLGSEPAELGRMDWQHPVGHTLAGPTLRSTTHCCEGSDEGGTS